MLIFGGRPPGNARTVGWLEGQKLSGKKAGANHFHTVAKNMIWICLKASKVKLPLMYIGRENIVYSNLVVNIFVYKTGLNIGAFCHILD